MVRKVGSGSYGEVWLAHSLTGARRAVKIVRRSNFDSAKSFEREFEGIQRYEPISRGHPSLLPILHVGRSPDRAFYYYIMEAADPVAGGGDYRPLTLETQGGDGAPGRRRPDECWQIGRELSEGLGQLHAAGLIHRDVKPSNVIFVNGKAKLADLGLVTSKGRRTFVGTEGYLPPEGPGAPQSDVYSLGMVLYELATGMDRMEFPELPDDFAAEDAKSWRSLNTVICRACASDSKERYADGAAMAEALGQAGETPPARRAPAIWWAPFAAAAIGAVAYGAFQTGLFEPPEPAPEPIAAIDPVEEPDPKPEAPTVIEMVLADPAPLENPPGVDTAQPPDPPQPAVGSAKIISDPEGAEIRDLEGKVLGKTPCLLSDLEPGPVQFVLHLDGHRDESVHGRITAGEREILGSQLTPWSPPERGARWVNSLGIPFRADEGRHVAFQPVTEAAYEKFLKATGGSSRGVIVSLRDIGWTGDPAVLLAALPDDEKRAFCGWLAQADRKTKYFGPGHFYSWESLAPLPSGESAFLLIADRERFGAVQLISDPIGAEVFINGESIGRTPRMIPEVQVGEVAYELRLRGYDPVTVVGEVAEGEETELAATLVRNRLYLEGEPWTNSLGMKFVPLNGFACSIWETRLRDFDAFADATGREPHHKESDLPQTPDHPVVSVSRDDAFEFCDWLTKTDREGGWLDGDFEYRLPTDLQWSEAAGFPNEGRTCPEERDKVVPVIYPWGETWPPPPGAGNFASAAAGGGAGDDGFEFTAPVGTFEPRENGIFDLAGNVWEWVLDPYGGKNEELRNWGVARGGCWSIHDPTTQLTQYRNVLRPDRRESIYGFRVAIVRSEVTAESSN